MFSFRNTSSVFSLVSLMVAAGCALSSPDRSEDDVGQSLSLLQTSVDARIAAEANALNVQIPPLVSLQGALGRLTTAKTQTPGHDGEARFMLRNSAGQMSEVEISPALIRSAGGIARLTGSRVTVAGKVSPATGKLVATSLNIAAGPTPQTFVGQKRWLTVMCSFSDLAFPAGETADYFRSLYGNSYPGLNDYFSKASNGKLSIDGSTVVGWQPMPFPASFYQAQSAEARLSNMMLDCLLTSPEDFTAFDGVALAFSHNLDSQLIAGPVPLDGVRNYAFAMLSPATFRDQSLMARSLAIGMDLTFSGTAPGRFDSKWDIMSGGGSCRSLHPAHGCVGVFPAAEHAAKLGWLDANQIATPGDGLNSYALDFVGSPIAAGRHGLIRIPISATQYYTVEARNNDAGRYDRELPRAGVVIHKMDTTPVPDDMPTEDQVTASTTRLRFVDGNANNDPNDAGSEITTSFIDAAAKLRINVGAKRATGYDITVIRSPKLTVANPGNSGRITYQSQINCGMGSTACSADFDPGITVVLQGAPASGMRLASWSGCTPSEGNGRCSVSMDRVRSVSAVFEALPPTTPRGCVCEPQWSRSRCNSICGPRRPGDPPRQIP
jgi:hypothetical protein